METGKNKQEVQDLRNRLEQTEARIDDIQGGQSSGLENKAELN